MDKREREFWNNEPKLDTWNYRYRLFREMMVKSDSHRAHIIKLLEARPYISFGERKMIEECKGWAAYQEEVEKSKAKSAEINERKGREGRPVLYSVPK